MKLRVNPNRMEYSKLRKKLDLATRGHKLLKDKRDGLMQEFLKVVKNSKKEREEVEKILKEYYMHYIDAVMSTSETSLYEALMFPRQKIEPGVTISNRMGVRTPVYNYDIGDDVQSYGYLNTSGSLDRSLGILNDLLPKLIDMARVEKQIELMALEIEKTRRRVNTLEHFLIPSLEETIRYIRMKLSEDERAVATRLMRIKNIIRK